MSARNRLSLSARLEMVNSAILDLTFRQNAGRRQGDDETLCRLLARRNVLLEAIDKQTRTS